MWHAWGGNTWADIAAKRPRVFGLPTARGAYIVTFAPRLRSPAIVLPGDAFARGAFGQHHDGHRFEPRSGSASPLGGRAA